MKPKIIFVANTGFALYNFRLNLMKHLADNGFNIIAIANDENNYKEKFEKNNIKFINIPIDHKGKNPVMDIMLIKKLSNIYKEEKCDLVHHFTIKPVIFGSLAAKIAKVPSIINTITGLGYVFEKKGLLYIISILLYKLSLTGKTTVIFQNYDDLNFFLSKKIVKHLQTKVILGSGVDTSILIPNYRSPNHNITFLMVSRMLWSKGISEFVNAAEVIHRQYNNTNFLMVGGVSGGGAKGNPKSIPEKWLQDIDRKGIVRWMGRVSFHEVIDLMDKSEVVVLPTYYPEGIPKSLIEAASKGKPIVTTDTPGCREVVKHGVNGFLIPPKSTEALADTMSIFVNQPHIIKRMGAESRKMAINLFDDKIVFQKTIQLYNDTLKRYNC